MHLYKKGRLDFYGSLARFPFFNLKSEKSIEFSIFTYSNINSELLRKIKRWVYMKVHWKSKTWYKWKRFAKAAAAAAKSLQSSPTLCDPIDSSPPGSPVPGILQARTLEWVAISSSNTWEWKVKVKSLSRVRLLGTPWTAAYQAPPPMGFSKQEYWSGVPLNHGLTLIVSFFSMGLPRWH